eukprot:592981-Pelagomonas_calceolata.AAC.3
MRKGMLRKAGNMLHHDCTLEGGLQKQRKAMGANLGMPANTEKEAGTAKDDETLAPRLGLQWCCDCAAIVLIAVLSSIPIPWLAGYSTIDFGLNKGMCERDGCEQAVLSSNSWLGQRYCVRDGYEQAGLFIINFNSFCLSAAARPAFARCSKA